MIRVSFINGRQLLLRGRWTPRERCGIAGEADIAGVVTLDRAQAIGPILWEAGTIVAVTRSALVVDTVTGAVLHAPPAVPYLPGPWVAPRMPLGMIGLS